MKIGLCTFGGPSIGTGHLFRCIALAEWLERLPGEKEICFEIIDHDPDGPSVAREVVSGRSPRPYRLHCDQALPGERWDVLVVDRLRVNLDIASNLRQRAGLMISIDDTGPGRFLADIALNPLYRCSESIPRHEHFIDLQGPEYQIIAPAFSDSPCVWRENPTRLLITQGGADRHALAPRLIGALEPLLTRYPNLVMHVITGPAFRSDDALRPYMDRIGQRLVRHTDVANMPSLLRDMDIAVSAAGVAPFEIAALGIPAVLVTGEAKEVETADEIAKTGAAVSLGLYADGIRSCLVNEVDKLLTSPEKRASMRKAGLTKLSGRTGGELVTMINEKIPLSS